MLSPGRTDVTQAGVNSAVAPIKTETDKIAGVSTAVEDVDNAVEDVDSAVKGLAAVVGLIDDNPLVQTVIGRLETGYQHTHRQSRVYPTMEAGKTIIAGDLGGGGAWQLGAKVEIVPTGGIPAPFDIHWVYVENVSANGTYELVLYKGAVSAEVEIARVRFVRLAAQVRQMDVPIQIPVQSANTRISGAVACSAGDNNVIVSLYYHDYEVS